MEDTKVKEDEMKVTDLTKDLVKSVRINKKVLRELHKKGYVNVQNVLDEKINELLKLGFIDSDTKKK